MNIGVVLFTVAVFVALLCGLAAIQHTVSVPTLSIKVTSGPVSLPSLSILEVTSGPVPVPPTSILEGSVPVPPTSVLEVTVPVPSPSISQMTRGPATWCDLVMSSKAAVPFSNYSLFSFSESDANMVNEFVTKIMLQSDLSFWHTAFSKKSPLDVLVIGGSMVAGALCMDYNASLLLNECSYPARAATRLSQLLFPGTSMHHALNIENRARGGQTSKVMAAGLPGLMKHTVPPDIVVIDFTVNDLLELQEKGDLGSMCEAMILIIRAKVPDAAILFVVAPICPNCLDDDSTTNQVSEAAAHHGVTVLELRAASRNTSWKPWGGAANPLYMNFVRSGGHRRYVLDSDVEHFMGERYAHPMFEVHVVIGDMLAQALLSFSREVCGMNGSIPTPLPLPSNAPAKPYRFPHVMNYMHCLNPATEISAYYPPAPWALGNTTSDKGWIFTEDRKGKPGWISNGVENAVLSFKIKFGPKAPLMLSLTILKSYQGMGQAELKVGTVQTRPYPLDGSWTRPFSVSHVVTFWADSFGGEVSGDIGHFGFGATPGQEVDLNLTFVGLNTTKFKLISITAC